MTTLVTYERPVDVVTVTGPDAGSFLQSLLSQDLDQVQPGGSVLALLLQPQGKLIAPMVAARVAPETWWLVTDPGGGEPVRAGLDRFRLRVKAEISDASPEFAALALRGDGAEDLSSTIDGGQSIAVPGAWDGVDLIGRRADVERARSEIVAGGTTVHDADAYDAARIAAGVPRLGVDVDEKTIPQEAFLERSAVSFTKGCFVGQELVCRIDTRGRVNRFLRRVRLEVTAPVGADVVAGEKVVGALTSVAGTDALAMVRHEVEPPAEVVVRWPSGQATATVEAV